MAHVLWLQYSRLPDGASMQHNNPEEVFLTILLVDSCGQVVKLMRRKNRTMQRKIRIRMMLSRVFIVSAVFGFFGFLVFLNRRGSLGSGPLRKMREWLDSFASQLTNNTCVQ